jgi:hypothetical protein
MIGRNEPGCWASVRGRASASAQRSLPARGRLDFFSKRRRGGLLRAALGSECQHGKNSPQRHRDTERDGEEAEERRGWNRSKRRRRDHGSHGWHGSMRGKLIKDCAACLPSLPTLAAFCSKLLIRGLGFCSVSLCLGGSLRPWNRRSASVPIGVIRGPLASCVPFFAALACSSCKNPHPTSPSGRGVAAFLPSTCSCLGVLRSQKDPHPTSPAFGRARLD